MVTARIRPRVLGGARVLLALAMFARIAPAQEASARPQALVNGDMEEVDAQGGLAGWRVPSALRDADYEVGPERDDVHGGEGAARIDSREASADGNLFGNLMQSIDAAPYRGKRVRYSAAARIADAGGVAQLWMRVDLPAAGGTPRTGFFDNMGDRPITAGEWATYEIVGDVAPDAQSIALGVLTLGKCLVLVDDAALEVVEAEVATTGGDVLASAPTQPFWTAWLALPVVALFLFGLGFLGRGRLGELGLAFTLVYWTLYALPTLVASLIPWWGGSWSMAWEAGPVDAVVRWTATHVLGLDGELVPAIGNGSGDTTHAYVQALVAFVAALAAAAVWVLVARPGTDRTRVRELLRGGLRLYLAVMMLTYGLAKIGTLYNQFPAPGLDRLARTYGESSPMGLLWTFMGSSRAYTAFAGWSEILGGVLLVFGRTALLGALVSFGAMLNVMLLNFCYDVPVKLFSFHLVVVAACIALPDAGRLASLFLGIGRGEPPSPARQSWGRARWLVRAGKAWILVAVLALPIWRHARTERSVAGVFPALGEWKLARLELDGEAVAPPTGELERLNLMRRPVAAGDGWSPDWFAGLVGGAATSGWATLTAEKLALGGVAGGASRLSSGELSWRVEGRELRLEAAGLRASFTPAAHDHLLMRRGFRWINERPFNR